MILVYNIRGYKWYKVKILHKGGFFYLDLNVAVKKQYARPFPEQLIDC